VESRDLCRGCARFTKEQLSELMTSAPLQAEAWEVGAEHPPYGDQWPRYKCALCGRTLTDRDN
jgi:hypothetical protein